MAKNDTSLEISTIRMLTDRDKYERYARMIPDGAVNATTATIVKRMGEFFAGNDAQKATFDLFWPYLRTRYPKWTDEQREQWMYAVKPMDEPNPPGTDEQIVVNLMSQRLGNNAIQVIEKWMGGGDIDLAHALRGELENFESSVIRRAKTADVSLSWDDMLSEIANPTGLQWHSECLREHARPLTGGDFGILAMRPDRGKTSLGAYEASWMAPQVLRHWPDRVRPTIWLNNEGPGKRIISRIRQAALGLSYSELLDVGPDAARARYIELMGGHEDLIIVKDIHKFTSWDVEALIERNDPGLVIWDMIDNVRFAGGTLNNGERTDQLLESMYQWARELAVRFDHVGIAMSQLATTAEGKRYPAQSELKDSGTGKQGAIDFMVAAGYDPSMPDTRFFSMPKNKLKLEGKAGSPKCPMFFDADRSQFWLPASMQEEDLKNA